MRSAKMPSLQLIAHQNGQLQKILAQFIIFQNFTMEMMDPGIIILSWQVWKSWSLGCIGFEDQKNHLSLDVNLNLHIISPQGSH